MPRELSLGFVSNVQLPESDLSLAFVWPVPRVMTVAVSLRYVNSGEQEATVDPSGKIGTLVPATGVITTTFAAPFGDRLSVGVNFKLLAVRFDCTGVCNATSSTPVTWAVDVGGQYIFTRDSLVTVGVSARNLGLPLQINDAPQSDALPKRLDLGLAYSPRFKDYPHARSTLATDVVSRLGQGGGSGVGSAAKCRGSISTMVAPDTSSPDQTARGTTFGVGIARGRWRADFAQFLSDFGGENGSKPTYFTLRYVF